mgnify:CR=1 FL=1
MVLVGDGERDCSVIQAYYLTKLGAILNRDFEVEKISRNECRLTGSVTTLADLPRLLSLLKFYEF